MAKKSTPLLLGRNEETVSDYDVVIDAYAYDEMKEQDLQQQQKQSEEKMYSQLYTLDEQLKVKPVEEIVDVQVKELDADFKKRKAKALKAAEKEQRKAEKLQKKQQKGEKHGGFGR